MQETAINDLRQQAGRVMRAYTELDALWNIIVAESRGADWQPAGPAADLPGRTEPRTV